MNLRALPVRVALVVLWAILAGCGADMTVDETPVSSNALADQTRVAEVFSSSLDGYGSGDTVQVQIVNDRLSVQGGGGTVPVLTGLLLTGTTPTYTGVRNRAAGVIETWTVTVDAGGLVTNVAIAESGTASGAFSAPAGLGADIAAGSDGVWTLGATGALQAETGSGATRMTLDAAGLLWWDLDSNTATTDDVVMIALKPDGADLAGKATVLYDWNAVAPDDLVVLSVRLTIAGGVVTHVLANADPVEVALGAGVDWVDDATPTATSSSVPLFGPWSASMAGHWLAIPTAGSTTISGAVAVTRQETERDAVGTILSASIPATSGSEQETVVITCALTEKSLYPVVRLSVDTVIDRVGSLVDETCRQAVYLARGSDGVVYRLGEWEDVNYDGVIDAGEETLHAGSPVLAFPASEPADGAGYPAGARWGLTTTASHLRAQTFAGVAGHAALVGQLTTATTTPAPTGFTSVLGTGTSARLTAYWLPGSGITGLRWASDSLVVRRLMRGDGTYQQVERAVTATSDLVLP